MDSPGPDFARAERHPNASTAWEEDAVYTERFGSHTLLSICLPKREASIIREYENIGFGVSCMVHQAH
ncbi:hypothetical protein HH1059_20290 [Halorhodospira halochloris]|uniref:Uncharacterized protein n=1 Tax=Halorhodospira halochloris TaxID=1052 RepID=A0A110B2H8_HALHR|nr:hypothetical protein HH1059_20290 [Halorhodospira halochloris]